MKKIFKIIEIFIQSLILKQRMNLVKKSEIKIEKLKLKLKIEEQLYKKLLIQNLEWINKI